MTVEKANLVCKSNLLVEAGYRLSLVEQRMILYAIAQCREEQRGLAIDRPVRITALKFAELFGMDKAFVYPQLRDAAKTFYARTVTVRDVDPESGKPRTSTLRWLSRASYIEEAGVVEILFAQEMIPLITRLESEFTSYRIEKIGRMSSAHAIRLYELLVQYLPIGSREIDLTWFKEALDIANEYQSIGDLKKRVVSPSVNQINELSDLTVSCGQRKTGRNVTHLTFDIKAKAKAESKPVRPRKPPITDAYIAERARPGESRELVVQRILAERD